MTSAADSLLWDPATLAVRLDDEDVVVLDVRRGERYANGHVPGARNFSVYGVNTYDSDPAPLASFTKMWAFQLVGAGIRREDTVVVCADFTDESAARAFWFLEYLGHERVAVLDGGVKAWVAAGHPLTHEARPPKANPYPYEAVMSVCATWPDVAAAIDDPSTVILDTRSDEGVVRRGRPRHRPRRCGARCGAPRMAPQPRRRGTDARPGDVAGALRDRRDHDRDAGHRLLQHRLSLGPRVPGASPARSSGREQLRRVLAGVGEPVRVSGRGARKGLIRE